MFFCNKNVCGILNPAYQIFNVVTKNRCQLWRHTFKKSQKYLYNCKNLWKTFLQLRCSNVLLHLKYKLPLCKPEIEFKNQTGAKALATDHRVIKAKFTYLLHLFSFLDQTCQIDYRCWPNDCKFLFDAKCQIVTSQRLTSPKWVKWSFQFQSQTYIIWKCFRRGVKPRKPFLATTRTTRVMGLQRNLIAPPGTILFLKKRSLWYFFSQFFAK